MKLTKIAVENYKGLRETQCKLSNLVCAIGENNAGKSSLLQAILLFINGPKLTKTEFYDSEKDIVITAHLSCVTEKILANLTEEQRTKITPYVKDESIVLARRYATDGSSKLRVVTLVPRDAKYHDDELDEIFKLKKGKDIAEILLASYPETTTPEEAATATTQKAGKEIIQKYITGLPPEQMMLADIPLPTGIDNSLRAILPEPIYIPAVKDLTDDLKTKESTSFGKLLKILLDVIEGDLTEASETFEKLRSKLNRVTQEDGTVIDGRMDRVKAIEATIQKNLQETFRNVLIELEIPPPEIKTVLSNATIMADDGVRGPVDNKGDGFKRAITFSILRSYVQLSQDATWHKETDEKPTKEKFLFLFEEPELYLHPRAQNILFNALSLISKKHQVVVTTHSPLFFSANETTTFIKVCKRRLPDLPKPVGECCPIDLTDITERDKFQIISFESSNMAFFSSKIVLVEGDTELIILPHLASLLDSRWDFKSTSINLVKVPGKGSFKRYRDFFKHFGVDIAIVADLDVLLEDFDKVYPSIEEKQLRDDLIRDVDVIIDAENKMEKPNPHLLKEELQRERAKILYNRIIAAREDNNVEEQTLALDELFVFERSTPRLEVLMDSSHVDILNKKRQLLSKLRAHGVFIWEKGAIENYYPDGVSGADKPSKAQSFCSLVKTADEVITLCNVIEYGESSLPEFFIILKEIFKC
ncbi:MAG: AAA family ATPase [Candidatus Neomarinimicrobiota bacterium]